MSFSNVHSSMAPLSPTNDSFTTQRPKEDLKTSQIGSACISNQSEKRSPSETPKGRDKPRFSISFPSLPNFGKSTKKGQEISLSTSSVSLPPLNEGKEFQDEVTSPADKPMLIHKTTTRTMNVTNPAKKETNEKSQTVNKQDSHPPRQQIKRSFSDNYGTHQIRNVSSTASSGTLVYSYPPQKPSCNQSNNDSNSFILKKSEPIISKPIERINSQPVENKAPIKTTTAFQFIESVLNNHNEKHNENDSLTLRQLSLGYRIIMSTRTFITAINEYYNKIGSNIDDSNIEESPTTDLKEKKRKQWACFVLFNTWLKSRDFYITDFKKSKTLRAIKSLADSLNKTLGCASYDQILGGIQLPSWSAYSFSSFSPINSPSSLSPVNSPSSLSLVNSPSSLSLVNSPSSLSPTNSRSSLSPTNSASSLSPANSASSLSPVSSPSSLSPASSPSSFSPVSSPSSFSLIQVRNFQEFLTAKNLKNIKEIANELLCLSIKVQSKINANVFDAKKRPQIQNFIAKINNRLKEYIIKDLTLDSGQREKLKDRTSKKSDETPFCEDRKKSAKPIEIYNFYIKLAKQSQKMGDLFTCMALFGAFCSPEITKAFNNKEEIKKHDSFIEGLTKFTVGTSRQELINRNKLLENKEIPLQFTHLFRECETLKDRVSLREINNQKQRILLIIYAAQIAEDLLIRQKSTIEKTPKTTIFALLDWNCGKKTA